MRKGILTMIAVILLSVSPCLAAELEFPQVDELWGSSKDDDWKAQEVQRLLEERGIAEMNEPALCAESI